MTDTLVAVVLAGGTGTRLYPASRSDRPKQFLPLAGDRSLLAETVDRAGFADEVYVLTRPDLADQVREHAPNAAVLTEPEPKDTGPALVYAAHRVREQVGDCTLVCLPSDHHIEGDFAGTMGDAAAVAAETDSLVTVGVEPTRPETGYGYIKPGEESEAADGRTYYPVEKFTEKPDQGAAMRYRHHGYYWNAGMFAWTPDAFLREAGDTELAPLVDALDDGEPERGFDAVDPVSVDYAVMEATDDATLVPATFEWDDLGAWDAVSRVVDADDDGNAVLGDALTIDAENTVVATDGHVSVVGVEDLVVASYGDRTLVVPKGQAQRVREVVSELKEDDLF
ncbi:mannose-1-phosphate guanylyltransferase [Halosimplex carlsbadense 2-9-1]|uniref:Mannose-1-phosphate guanylyltransferase n=1 Tax=Halosimplex carlsbadense 2-9-1 TaxID=797114 RepID=M0CWB9_9EURY|nr:sugar phosphate nucleotidyltransferase [Halosimplex carlsbadense]ELZ27501.1 mannose-1-phosphate guanylyltransferase [Halosimplex carlsbadense 2-9-1]